MLAALNPAKAVVVGQMSWAMVLGHGVSLPQSRRRESTTLGQRLSAREREVLSLLTEGSRSPCVAARLGICNATVEVRRRNISRKLGLHGVAELTKYAVRQGLTRLWT